MGTRVGESGLGGAERGGLAEEGWRCRALSQDGSGSSGAEAGGRVTARVVRGEERAAFLGRLYGGFKEAVERRTVRLLTELCGAGTLGAWQFVALSSGGGYLRPPEKVYCLRAPNYREGCVSAEVAGIVTSLLALADLHTTFRAEGIFGLRYRQLHAYAVAHTQAGEIFRFVDF